MLYLGPNELKKVKIVIANGHVIVPCECIFFISDSTCFIVVQQKQLGKIEGRRQSVRCNVAGNLKNNTNNMQ